MPKLKRNRPQAAFSLTGFAECTLFSSLFQNNLELSEPMEVLNVFLNECSRTGQHHHHQTPVPLDLWMSRLMMASQNGRQTSPRKDTWDAGTQRLLSSLMFGPEICNSALVFQSANCSARHTLELTTQPWMRSISLLNREENSLSCDALSGRHTQPHGFPCPAHSLLKSRQALSGSFAPRNRFAPSGGCLPTGFPTAATSASLPTPLGLAYSALS